MPRTAQDFATAAKINRFEKFERFGISRVPMRGAIKSHAGERLPEPLANVLGLRDQAEPLEKMIEVVAALKTGAKLLRPQPDDPQSEHSGIVQPNADCLIQYGLRARCLQLEAPRRWENALREHETNMAHLRTGDVAALTATMCDHVGTRAAITTADGLVMLDGAANDWVHSDA